MSLRLGAQSQLPWPHGSLGSLKQLESQKLRMLEGGVWIAETPGSRVAGFHLDALYPPWSRWEELVREWLEAQGIPEKLRVFVNTVLGEIWEDEGERITPGGLRAHCPKYAAEVPAGAGLLTCAVDVQGDRSSRA
ncbi:MAG: terminase gpA endonuclease subunit [Pseudomonas sp.]